MKKILLATPLKGDVSPRYVHDLLSTMLRRIDGVTFDFRFLEGPAIPFARNELAHATLTEGYDALVMVDKDVPWTPEQMARLCSHEEPIVCGAYAARMLQTTWLFQPAQGAVPNDKGLLAMARCSVGFSKITRGAFETIAAGFTKKKGMYAAANQKPVLMQDFFPLGLGLGADGHMEFQGEDYQFCRMAQQSGLRVWLDTQLVLGHEMTVSVPIATETLMKLINEPWRGTA